MPSNVHVLMFDETNGAENMLDNVDTWEAKGWIKVQDAVIAKRGSGSEPGTIAGAAYMDDEQHSVMISGGDSAELEIKQTHKTGGKYALRSGGIGLLAGWLLAGPLAAQSSGPQSAALPAP